MAKPNVGNVKDKLSEPDFYEMPDEGKLDDASDNRQSAKIPAAPWLGQQSPIDPKEDSSRRHVDENGHRIVLVDREELTVVEGDLLLDIDQKQLWQETLNFRQAEMRAQLKFQQAGFDEAAINPYGTVSSNRYGTVSSALVGIMQDGKLLRWSQDTVLTYCVLRHTFPRDEWYEEVVANMEAATDAWEQTCGVSFEYRHDLDESSSLRPQGAVFPVRYISANGAFIAAAFFPNDVVNRRRVLIDPSYFTTTFDHIGVLRHELGHVLGFRHEHIRSGAPPICPDESTTETVDLTAYDPQSVMHYFCGGVGSRNLAITDVDRAGSQRVYGPPLTTFEFQEV